MYRNAEPGRAGKTHTGGALDLVQSDNMNSGKLLEARLGGTESARGGMLGCKLKLGSAPINMISTGCSRQASRYTGTPERTILRH